MSRGFSLFSRTTDASEANLADFLTDRIGANINFGIPLTEYTSARFGLGVEDTNLVVNEAEAPLYYSFFVQENGNEFLTFVSTFDHTFDTRNRTLFPDTGLMSRFSAEVAFPGGDLEYYKASYNLRWYNSFHRHVSLLIGGEVAYGDG